MTAPSTKRSLVWASHQLQPLLTDAMSFIDDTNCPAAPELVQKTTFPSVLSEFYLPTEATLNVNYWVEPDTLSCQGTTRPDSNFSLFRCINYHTNRR
ncbi:hypothetical protein [Chroococcidiopsis sp.]|uniref:hypothetical protein n=1 Tax=Chroococcidiopsis sp. TaxID=3088168 RepID=UPI003F36A7AB